MNDILTKINILSQNNDNRLYDFVLGQLAYESNDINFWLSLAIVIVAPPFGDHEISIKFINKALAIDNNNPIALIILAHVYEYESGGIDDMLLHQIKNLHTDSDEINSMLKYVASWSYSDGKKNDPAIEERLLKESIRLCDKHVWNYEHLARLYIKQKRYLEINSLIKEALKNIQYIYSNNDDYDITDINEFINEHIKGVHLTNTCVEIVREKLIPIYIVCFYTIITPFVRFYEFIKTKILQSMHLE